MSDGVPQESGEAATVSSYLDGFEGAFLVGWAYSHGGAKHCHVSVVDGRGRTVGEGEASLDRPDLASLGLGRSDFAFRIPVADLGQSPLLHAFADGVEMHGSPLLAGKGHFDGHLYVEEGCAAGWVTERLAQFAPPRIDIAVCGGDIVASGPSRRDDGGEPGFWPARFRIPLAALVGGREFPITALADGVPFARATCTLRLVSHLEVLTPGHCAGWMFSPDAPAARLAVEIRRDGALVATVPCDRARHDVRAAHPGSNASGFDAALPGAGMSPEEPCEISFRLAGSQSELFGGPFTVASRNSAVAALRRIARTVHDPAAPFSRAERGFFQRALAGYVAAVRQGGDVCAVPGWSHTPPVSSRRLTVVIPVYRGVAITEDCIASVLRHRQAQTDFVVIVNDASPDDGMERMLTQFADEENLLLLANATNLGFVKTVNRALNTISDGDVVLLNSDTEVFAGTFDGLHRVAHASPGIGTVTPLSNNATIFSYPHARLRRDELPEISCRNLAALAQERNAGAVVDVPTAHGFCMFIRREVLHHIGAFDEAFGRGYGEENDLCARAADLGFRNVAAGGIFVFHHESVSFAGEKTALLSTNLATIASRYPEYHASIMAFEREDGMRSARWALDIARLAAARGRGTAFSLVVTNWLEGGTAEGIRDIAKAAGAASGAQLVLACREDGFLQLDCGEPLIRATFSPSEWQPLFRMLTAAEPTPVVIHQVLGYDANFIRALTRWIPGHHSLFYLHDYFSICPRVTMIDAAGSSCGKPPTDVCNRCIAVGGPHTASRLKTVNMEEHHELMKSLLGRVTHVVAPSECAARYVRKTYPDLAVVVVAHPETERHFPDAPRAGSNEEILVLGAIGPHKGSQTLLEMARLARLKHPELKFRVVGYTDIDEALREAGNVEITGPYESAALPALMAQCRGRLALFLHQWPETYSYALSEAASHGFIPLVPDIGAPAERVHETGFGLVFPFPIDAGEVLTLITDIAQGRRQPFRTGATPARFARAPEERARLRAMFGIAAPASLTAASTAQR